MSRLFINRKIQGILVRVISRLSLRIADSHSSCENHSLSDSYTCLFSSQDI